MRSLARACVAGTGVWIAMAGLAAAQPADGYIGVMVQSSFGNVTSQAFGLEAGYAVSPSFDLFLEGGRTLDAAPASTGRGAQLIAAELSKTQANVGYTVAEPINFVDAGVRYRIHLDGKLQPYVLAGGGVGMVKPDVKFTIGGTDVTSRMDQFGIALGTDLSGTTTKFMMVAGAGVRYPLTSAIYVDAEFRYNRVFISGGGIPFSRAGIGLGLQF